MKIHPIEAIKLIRPGSEYWQQVRKAYNKFEVEGSSRPLKSRAPLRMIRYFYTENGTLARLNVNEKLRTWGAKCVEISRARESEAGVPRNVGRDLITELGQATGGLPQNEQQSGGPSAQQSGSGGSSTSN